MRLKANFAAGNNGTASGMSTHAGTDRTRRREGDRQGSAPSPAARNLALAHYLDRLLDRGVIADFTHAARMLGVSQPRMTHVMGLLLLAPSIQEAILLGKIAPKDKELRVLARVTAWQAQELIIRASTRS